MLQSQSIVRAFDNSGAKKVYIIKGHLCRNSRFVYINGLIKISVRSLRKKGNISVKLGYMYLAVLVKTHFFFNRFSGNYYRFCKNGVILIDFKKHNLILGTRIFGGVSRELRNLKFVKIMMLASFIL